MAETPLERSTEDLGERDTSSWASKPSSEGGTAFESLHSGLTVQLIMTPRSGWSACRPEEEAVGVVQRNVDRYSYLPVTDADGRVKGLFHAEPWFDAEALHGTISEHLLPLEERNLIGADASIIEFVKQADERPFCLVVTGHRIEGLVSLSDLQQLPVRAALFALITGLELTMAAAIRAAHPGMEAWRRYLSYGRLEKIQTEIETSRAGDTYVDDLLFTQFIDKAEIIRKSMDLGRSGSRLEGDFQRLQKLRDKLAHANEYAASVEEARQVAADVRTAFGLQTLLTCSMPRSGHA